MVDKKHNLYLIGVGVLVFIVTLILNSIISSGPNIGGLLFPLAYMVGIFLVVFGLLSYVRLKRWVKIVLSVIITVVLSYIIFILALALSF